MMDTDKVGKFIASRRKICGLTQQELADELGITNKAVSKWETGQGMPDITALPLLADILGTTVDELLNGEKRDDAKENGGNVSGKQRVVYWFKAAAALSVFFAVVGAVVPFFMLKEASVTASILFGCWWEICSAAVFFTLYFRMKNVLNDSNKCMFPKLNPYKIRNQFLRIELWLWLVVPSGLIAHLILLIFSDKSFGARLSIALVLTALSGTLVFIKLIKKQVKI